ncbi:MAG: hotdog fold domain-containing protein [Solirubrobacteraceae bacterium]|nr:hotdog fold domain-containing protein [Patulibacter sp.]
MSRGYRLAAPYFLTIPARLDHLEPGRAVASMPAVPWTRNHLGTVHAIAQCNLAEYAMGALAEATIPDDTHRWIPRGMTVDYLAKAKGTLRAEATLTLPPLTDQQELGVAIDVTDGAGTVVSRAEIRFWVTAKRAA